MSKVLDKWDRENPGSGGYGHMLGFEVAIRGHDFGGRYMDLDIYDRIQLFDFVRGLLEEEAGEVKS